MMSEEQNKFYSSISKHYSEIFPFKPAQLRFVGDLAGDMKGQKILDVGCATGELSYRLSEGGAMVTGIDLNPELLKQARAKFNKKGLEFKERDMLQLKEDFPAQSLDFVLCFGNTLVHLQNETLIRKFLLAAWHVLRPGGRIVIQILNYDYIVDEKIEELPLIETKDLKFIRKYKFTEGSSTLRFQTDLVIKTEGITVSNETSLLALKSSTLVKLLLETQYKSIKLFSNFKGEEYGGSHLPLVATAKKQF